MARKNKFKKGPKIYRVAQFASVMQGHGWIYWNHKLMHFGFVINMPYRTICYAIDKGILWEAVKNE